MRMEVVPVTAASTVTAISFCACSVTGISRNFAQSMSVAADNTSRPLSAIARRVNCPAQLTCNRASPCVAIKAAFAGMEAAL